MTREEAIEILENTCFFGRSMDNIDLAIEMGVKALELEPEIKEAYNKGYKDGQEALAYHLELCKEEGSVITVPEGATNGDMIKALFPNIQWDNECDGVFYGYKTNDRMMAMLGVDFNWWNSHYRKEQK